VLLFGIITLALSLRTIKVIVGSIVLMLGSAFVSGSPNCLDGKLVLKLIATIHKNKTIGDFNG